MSLRTSKTPINTVEAAKRSGYTAAHLNFLARTGKIPAVREGNGWLIYANDLAAYEARAKDEARKNRLALARARKEEYRKSLGIVAPVVVPMSGETPAQVAAAATIENATPFAPSPVGEAPVEAEEAAMGTHAFFMLPAWTWKIPAKTGAYAVKGVLFLLVGFAAVAILDWTSSDTSTDAPVTYIVQEAPSGPPGSATTTVISTVRTIVERVVTGGIVSGITESYLRGELIALRNEIMEDVVDRDRRDDDTGGGSGSFDGTSITVENADIGTLFADHATTTSFYTSTLGLGSDYLTDFTGYGLAVVNGELTVTLAASPFATSTADAWFTTKTTDDLAEGSLNLYYTNARARSALSGGTGISYSTTTGIIALDASGDWTGTFDGFEGSYYLANSFSTTSALAFEATQTSRTADDLSDNSLEDLLDVSAMTKSVGDLLYWTGSAWANIATSSLGITGGGGPTVWGSITGTLSDQTDLQAALDAKFSLADWYATTTDALDEGLTNFYFTNTRADARIAAATTTIRSMFSAGTGLTYSGGQFALNATGDWTGTFDGQEGSYYLDRANHTGTQLASTISDFATAARGLFSGVSPISYNSGTGAFSISTSSLGLTTTDVAEGSNLYYTDGRVNAYIAASSTIAKTDVAQTWTAGQTIASNLLTVSGLANGCVEIVAGQLTSTGSNCGTGSGGITSINGLTASSQTFATSSDTNIGLTVTSSGSVHTFTPSWIGTLASGRGGTGISSVAANQLLIGNSTGTGWTQIATSSLGYASSADLADYLSLADWNATTTDALDEGITNLYFTNARARSALSAGNGISYSTTTGIIALNATGDWTGTFDGQEGSYYLDRANHTGTQLASTISDFASTARGLFSSTATGLTYDSGTGVFSLTSGYTIPLTASTTEWSTAYGWGNHATAGYLTAISTSTVRGMFSASSPLAYNSSTGNFSLSTSTFSGPGSGFDADFLDGFDSTYFLANAFSTTSANAWLATKTTDDLAQGSTNLYFSNVLARNALSAGTGISYSTTTGIIALNATGDWTGTFDGQEGSYYLDRANHSGTQLASTISDFASTARGLFSSTATGLTYTSGTGVFSLTPGYEIPTTASTTAWNSFYETPSTRITAGTGLIWTGNTLSVSTSSLANLNADTLDGLDSTYFLANSFSTTSANVWLATKTTDDLTQGNTNLYFSNALARNALSAGAGLTYSTTTGTFALNATGDWTGTFDGQEGTYYLDRANHTGTQLSNTISDFAATARGLFSDTITGITYTTGTGVFSLDAGYTIPLTASTTEWSQAYASTTALTPAYIRGLFSNTATGLTYNSTTGATSLTSGYEIPTTASTTNWNGFYDVPSTRITAGTALSWAGNTLNFVNPGYITSAITSLAGVTDSIIALTTGTSGTDFNIATSSGSIVLNIPTASGSNRGLLSSADWTTFNGKQAAGNYITALTGDVTASGPGSAVATLATVNSNIGTFNSVTVNAKGLVTAASNVLTDLASGVTGILPVPNGGTGVGYVQPGRLLYGNGTGALATTSGETAGYVLQYNGTNPTWVATSTLGITSGGTGGVSTTSANTWSQLQTFSSGINVNGETFTDLTGTGLINTGGALTLDSATVRGLFSSSATGLTYNSGTGDFSLTSGYTIPLTASTTEWNTFYQTPSTRITAGTGLSWTGNTLSVSTSSLALDTTYFKQGGNSFGATGILGTNDANDLQFETNNSTKLTITSAGNIGIGTTTPTARLSIVSGDAAVLTPLRFGNAVSNWNIPGIFASSTVTTGSLSAANADFTTYIPSSGGSTYGRLTTLTIPTESSTAFSTGLALSAQSRNYGTGNISNFWGSQNYVVNLGAATIGTMTGSDISVGNANNSSQFSTTTNAYGARVVMENSTTNGSIANMYGLYSSATNAGRITNAYGLYITGFGTGGTYTNTPYNVYAADAGAHNYFAGNVGIGTTTPGSLLTVAGNTYIGGTLTVASTSLLSGLATFSSGISVNGETFTDLTGTGLTNSGGVLTVDTASLAGNFFVQGGNSFGTTAVLGTNDAQSLALETGGVTRLSINTSGVVDIDGSIEISDLDLNVNIGRGNSLLNTPLTSVALGAANILNLSSYGSAVGYGNTVTADFRGSAFGYGNASGGDRSSAFGYLNTVSAEDASAFGSGITNSIVGSTMIGPNDAAKMTILSSGNVGIGTTTPAAPLDVYRLARVTGNSTAIGPTAGAGLELSYDSDGNLGALSGGSGNAYIQSFDRTASAWRDLSVNGRNVTFGTSIGLSAILTSSGNFGIGTTTPAYKIDVSGGTGIVGQFSGRVIGGNAVNSNEFTTLSQLSAATSSLSSLYFLQGGNSFGTTAVLGTNDVQSLAFETNGTTKMTILSGGNVGIGTTSPSAKFAITGTAGTEDIFAVASSTNARLLTVTSAGNVGIANAAPTFRFQIGGSPSNQSGLFPFTAGYVGTHAQFTPNGTLSGPVAGIASQLVLGGLSTGVTTAASIYGELTHSSGAGDFVNGYAVLGAFAGGSQVNAFTSVAALGATFKAGGGTLTNAYGLKINDLIHNAGGTLTNTYGAYVGDITAGTQTNTPYSFYASDANAFNYFAGNTGIGTTTPTARLSITGASTASTTFGIRVADSSNVPLFTVDDSGQIANRGTGTALAVTGIYRPFQITNSYNTSGSGVINIIGHTTSQTVNNTGTSVVQAFGGNFSSSISQTVNAAAENRAFGLAGSTAVGAGNTQNWAGTDVNAPVGVRGAFSANGGSGAIALGSAFSAFISEGGGNTLTKAYGYRLSYISGDGIANAVGAGLYNLAGTNNTYLMLSNTQNAVPASGNYAIYDETGYNSYLSGNVGIGTTTPAAKLHVFNGAFTVGTQETATSLSYGFQVRNNGNAFTESFLQTQGIRLGMYTNPQASGQLGATGITYPAASAGFISTSHLVLGAAGTEYMRISGTTGNVGIGTTTPNVQLSVIGSINSGSDSETIRVQYRSDINQYAGFGVDGSAINYGAALFLNGTKRFVVEGNGGALIGSTYVNQNAPTNGLLVEGSVGIGTTTPGQKLTVAGNIESTGYIALTGSNQWLQGTPSNWGSTGYIQFGVDENLGVAGNYLTSYVPSGKGISWAIAGASKMLINSSGNVGIGTVIPRSRLDVVSGTVPTSGTYTGQAMSVVGPDISSYSNQSTGNLMVLGTGSTAADNGGTISLWGLYNSTTGLSYATIKGAQESGSALNGYLAFRTLTNNSLTEKVRIDSAGRVGIGTATPGNPLEIRYSSATQSGLYLNSSDSGSFNSIKFALSGSNIGTFGLNNSSGEFKWAVPSSGGYFATINTGGSERLRVDASGNVGIGTTNPLRKLDLSASGQLTFGDNVIADSSQGIYFHSGSDYGIYRTAGAWSAPNYAQLQLKFITGIVIDGGSGYGKSGTVLQPSGGNVGIGVAVPTARLQVENANANQTTLLVSGIYGGVSGGKGIHLLAGAGTGSWSLNVRQAAEGDFAIYDVTNAATRFYIASTGAVSIANLVSCGGIQTNGSGTMSCTSDERLKDVQGEFSSGLAALRGITPQNYTWKDGTDMYDGGIEYSGFIAQNVGANLPEAMGEGAGGWKQINTTTILAAAVNGIKELDMRTLSLAPASENQAAKNLEVSADATIAGKLTVTGTGSFESVITTGAITAGSFLTASVTTLPSDVLTNGSADIYKMASYAITGLASLTSRTDLIVERLETVEEELAAMKLAAETGGTGATLSLDTLNGLLAQWGIMIDETIARFKTLSSERLFAAADEDGEAYAGSAMVLAGNTVIEVQNSRMTATSKVIVTLASAVDGYWYVSEKQEGSFRLHLEKSQDTDITFDYLIVDTDATMSAQAPAPAPTPEPAPLPAVMPGPTPEPTPVIEVIEDETPEVPAVPEPPVEEPSVTPAPEPEPVVADPAPAPAVTEPAPEQSPVP